jgi:hypothetical protein
VFLGAAPDRLELKWDWLAPTVALLFVLLGMLSPPGNEWAPWPASRGGPAIALSVSNQSLAAYLPGSFRNRQNRPIHPSFDWTNAGASPSSMASFTPWQTNGLRPER